MEEVSPEETISRYATDKSYRRADGTVRHNAFTPARDGAVSVFRIKDLTEEGIWEIGNREVAQKRGKPLLGRADIVASHVFARKLNIEPDNNPARHANIIGWPDKEDKSKIKEIAMELASNAEFRQYPLPE